MALKVFREALYGEASHRRRFMREARILARVEHPNIVRCFEAGEHEGHPFFVMEFLECPTLSELVEAGNGLPPERAATIAVGVAEALAAAHEAGVIHRDLKSSNVFVAEGDRAVLVELIGDAATAAG